MGAAKLLSQLNSSKLGLYSLFISLTNTQAHALEEKKLIEAKPTTFMDWSTTLCNPRAGDKLQHLRRPESF